MPSRLCPRMRLLDPIRDLPRNRDRLDAARIVDHAAGAGGAPAGQRHAVARDLEAVGQRAGPLADHPQMDLQHVAEPGGGLVVARDRHPRPGDLPPLVPEVDAGADRRQEGVLGVLHEDEKAREVDDAAHVRVHVLDLPADAVLVHGPPSLAVRAAYGTATLRACHTSSLSTRGPPAPGPSSSTSPAPRSPPPRGNSSRSSPSPAGWSTTPGRSGSRSSPWPARP